MGESSDQELLLMDTGWEDFKNNFVRIAVSATS